MKSSSLYVPKNGKNSASKSSQSQKEIGQLSQELNQSIMQFIQQQRVIWLMAKAAGGSIVIDEQGCSPLWTLKFEKADKPNHLKIIAGLLPEPTEEQLTKLAAILLGKSDNPTQYLEQVGLQEYPLQYVMLALTPKVILNDGTWISKVAYDQLPKVAPKPQSPQSDAV